MSFMPGTYPATDTGATNWVNLSATFGAEGGFDPDTIEVDFNPILCKFQSF